MVGSARRGNLVLVLLVVVAFIWLVPVIWMLSMSLQPNEVLARTTSNTFFGLIPIPFTWENFVNLFTLGLAPRWFLNSMIVATGMTAAVLVLSSLAGFAFARVPFRGRSVVLAIVLAARLFPIIRTLISVPAGLARMNPWTFTLYSMIGMLIWNTILVSAGYLLHENYHIVEDWLDPLSYVVLGTVIVVYLFRVVTWRPSRVR